MLTSKRTDVSSHPWVVSYDSSLWRYWGRCYLGDSASTPLLRHVLLLLPDHPQVCAFSHLPCFGSNPLMLLTMSFSFYFNPFPMPSLNHSALSPYITKFLNWNYSHMSIWTQHWSFPSCPPPHKWETPSGTGPHSPLSNQKALGSIPTSCLPCGNISLTYDSVQVLFSLGSLAFCGEVGSVTPFMGPHSLLTLSCCLY